MDEISPSKFKMLGLLFELHSRWKIYCKKIKIKSSNNYYQIKYNFHNYIKYSTYRWLRNKLRLSMRITNGWSDARNRLITWYICSTTFYGIIISNSY